MPAVETRIAVKMLSIWEPSPNLSTTKRIEGRESKLWLMAFRVPKATNLSLISRLKPR